MSNKNKKREGIVFSTDPDFNYSISFEQDSETLSPNKQQLRIFLDRKGGGKLVSRVSGFIGSTAELNDLATRLKKLCGGGGSVKDGEILIQGDHRDRIKKFFDGEGYSSKLAGG